MIAEWINAVTTNSQHQHQHQDPTSQAPQLVVDDFSPSMPSNTRFPNTTLTLGSGITQMDLANLNERVGTLTMRGGGGGKGLGLGLGLGKMLREESRFDLAGASVGDDMF